MSQQNVPLVDLSHQQKQINDVIREGFNRVIAESSFIMGPQVEEFEGAWAKYCGVRFAIGVGSGTDAVELALRATEVGPGDEVILPANTFVATAGAVLRAGAKVVLADCNDDFLLDPEEVAGKITPRTKAVIGVHLYGQAAPMELIAAAAGHDMTIIEDMAQAQGARRYGIPAGGLGDVAATSFYPGKNLGAYGDAGAVTTSSDEIARRLRNLRNHGGNVQYEHLEVGFNSRLDTLQAVVLNAKLMLLDQWNQERAAAANLYAEMLEDCDGVVLPGSAPGNDHVFHLYVVKVPSRDRVIAELKLAGIGAGIHYPKPIHLLPAYAHLGYRKGQFPRAEAFSRQILSLPLYPGISVSQQERVANALRSALGR